MILPKSQIKYRDKFESRPNRITCLDRIFRWQIKSTRARVSITI